jgi:integrase
MRHAAELLEKWLVIKKEKVKETTWYSYRNNVSRWLHTRIAKVPIQKLKAMEIEQALSSIKGKPHAKKDSYMTLLTALNKAVKWKLISENPMNAVEPVKVEMQELLVWTEKETLRFLETAKKSVYYVMFVVALKTGTRISELLGLQWRNVDLEAREIRIVQGMVELPGGRKKVQSPKTKRSVRKIPIDSKTVQMLQEYKAKREEVALKKGYKDVPWVFWSDRTGQPPARNKPWRALRIYAEKAGLGKSNLHRLRHSHATFLLRKGVHPKIVAERLGHSMLSMTERYSHVLPDSQQEAVKAMEKMEF